MAEPENPYYGLEICFHGAVADEINRFRQKFDSTYLEIAPHISITYPPFVSYEQWDEIRPVVIDCLSSFKPFRVTFKEIGIFMRPSPEEADVLWLKPEDYGIIARMRQALEKRLPAYVPPVREGYIPHLSIGFLKEPGAIEIARVEVQSTLQPLESLVTEITYEAQNKARDLHFFDSLPLIG